MPKKETRRVKEEGGVPMEDVTTVHEQKYLKGKKHEHREKGQDKQAEEELQKEHKHEDKDKDEDGGDDKGRHGDNSNGKYPKENFGYWRRGTNT